MDKRNLHELLSQAAATEAGGVFEEFMRQSAREMLLWAMMREVEAVCGSAYHPRADAPCRRAGSAPGRVILEGRAEGIKRPRMRKKSGVDEDREVVPASYRAAQDPGAVRAALLRALAAGVSTRDAGKVFPGAPGSSSSSVSQLWIEKGREIFAAFRSRDLSGEIWFGLMLDGVHLADELMAVVAVGLTVDGRKVVLDFELGASESLEVCNRLLVRVKERGVMFSGPPLAVLDGSDALLKSVRRHFEGIQVQRCLVHKERNIRSCLSKRHYGELALHFNLLRSAEGEDAARKRLADLRRFLAGHSRKATESLDEGGDDLITLHRLQAPSTLNASLLSTNGIENIFRSSRLKLGRVTRWRKTTDQPDRWLAYALCEAEKGFRRLKGWRDIPELLAGLKWPENAIAAACQRKKEVLTRELNKPPKK